MPDTLHFRMVSFKRILKKVLKTTEHSQKTASNTNTTSTTTPTGNQQLQASQDGTSNTKLNRKRSNSSRKKKTASVNSAAHEDEKRRSVKNPLNKSGHHASLDADGNLIRQESEKGAALRNSNRDCTCSENDQTDDRSIESESDDDVEEVDEDDTQYDEDDFVGVTFDFIDEVDSGKDASRRGFACLSPEEIVSTQHTEVRIVADLFSLSQSAAAAMLRHYSWKREVLIAKFLENPEAVRREVGIGSLDASGEIAVDSYSQTDGGQGPTIKAMSNLQLDLSLGSEVMCSICADDVAVSDTFALSCKHRFCRECWCGYLSNKINEGEVSRIKCPHIECKLTVDETSVKILVPTPVYDRYLRFITKSFVEHSDGRVKWCPQPNCGNAITSDMVTGTVVRCTCGYRFCFTCHREAHSPANCDQVKQWDKKCKDDSETTHWKYANTKDCIKCETPVEKNGGCNHMTCRQCKHEWCWVCMRPWKGHNDYYNCNKFLKMKEENEKKKRRSANLSGSTGSSSLLPLFGSSRKKDRIREKEAERERNRLALERYLHYYERYANHSHSSELEKQIRNRAITRMSELQKEATTTSEVQYILEGTEILLECRNVLKYTYVYAYSLPEKGAEKELFEYLQEDLEKTTEQLSEILETPATGQVHRLKALNIIQLAKTRKDNLLNAVEQNSI